MNEKNPERFGKLRSVADVLRRKFGHRAIDAGAEIAENDSVTPGDDGWSLVVFKGGPLEGSIVVPTHSGLPHPRISRPESDGGHVIDGPGRHSALRRDSARGSSPDTEQ